MNKIRQDITVLIVGCSPTELTEALKNARKGVSGVTLCHR